ncbi:WAS/WASL-interacting protein family member 1-like [Phasianus colchicus]|uniref:WAS/WASL-interacting protein family member 1-like n=1 Tax=Phasianus colchicus TaxID=9054 RepID=UPI00129D3292|nr:WAS/WASL-interacting protein family member 1-like [Phasianus colchicus]
MRACPCGRGCVRVSPGEGDGGGGRGDGGGEVTVGEYIFPTHPSHPSSGASATKSHPNIPSLWETWRDRQRDAGGPVSALPVRETSASPEPPVPRGEEAAEPLREDRSTTSARFGDSPGTAPVKTRTLPSLPNPDGSSADTNPAAPHALSRTALPGNSAGGGPFPAARGPRPFPRPYRQGGRRGPRDVAVPAAARRTPASSADTSPPSPPIETHRARIPPPSSRSTRPGRRKA